MSLANHRLSWPNWILAGKNFLDVTDQLELDRRIGTWTTDELIDAVTFLLKRLKAVGSYHTFMASTVCSIHPSNDAFKDALSKIWRAGDLIATTNYDLTIEESIDAETVSYLSPAEILSIIRGGANKVIHLHGVYDRLHGVDDIIADDPQYKGILANAGAQFIQNLISTHPIIIVGCGGTVQFSERHQRYAEEVINLFSDPLFSFICELLLLSLRVGKLDGIVLVNRSISPSHRFQRNPVTGKDRMCIYLLSHSHPPVLHPVLCQTPS